MIIENIETALTGLRDVIYEEIRKELEINGPVDINVQIPCDIDEDRYHTTTLTKVFLDEENNVTVASTDDLDGEESTDDLSLYSVDEMLKIVAAM